MLNSTDKVRIIEKIKIVYDYDDAQAWVMLKAWLTYSADEFNVMLNDLQKIYLGKIAARIFPA